MKDYNIKTIDPDSKKLWKEGRTFTVCPFTPLVRKRLYNFFIDLIDNMPVEVVKSFKQNSYDMRNAMRLITDIIQYLEKNDKLESLVAIIVRDFDKSDKIKDTVEIAEYLELNCKPSQEVAMLADFFGTIELEETLDILQSMKMNLLNSLNLLNLEK